MLCPVCCVCCVPHCRSVDALESHDVVFWLGDLNYRINGNSKVVRHLMRSRLHEVLHANDQLRLQQKMGTVFQVCVGRALCVCTWLGADDCRLLLGGTRQGLAASELRRTSLTRSACSGVCFSCRCNPPQGFQEGRIRFPPTFKFLPGSSAYSEKRVPSWTDRILWKVRSSRAVAPPQQQQQAQPEQQPQLSWVSGDGSMNDSSGALPQSDPPSVSQLYYTSVPDITSSDHKPVVAGFEVGLVLGGEREQSQQLLLQRASTGSSRSDDDGGEEQEEGLRMKHGRCCCIM